MKNFIIVGTQRTGSSVIAEIVGLHPMVTCGWEWTLSFSRRNRIAFSDRALALDFSVLGLADQNHMANAHSIENTWIGFRWLFSSSFKWVIHPRFSPALWVDRLEDFIEWVSNRPATHIIHVFRENNMEWLKSIYMARKSNLYSKKQYPDGFKVRIPIWEAVNRVTSKNWVDNRLKTLKQTNPFFCIRYEDFLSDNNRVGTELNEFLKIDEVNLDLKTKTMKKQSKTDASNYITNYFRLKEVLLKRKLLTSRVV